MGTRIIKLPDVGEGVAEAEIVDWHVEVGQSVLEDQILAAVMTDKATVEIPSPVAGKVLALGGEVGQTLAVGSELIRIDTEGKSEAKQRETETVAAPAAPREKAAPRSEVRAPADRPIASPAVRRRAWELGIDLKDVRPSGTAGRIMQADLDAHVAARGPTLRAPEARPALPSEPAAEQAGENTG